MTEIGRDKIAPERWPPSVYSGKQKDLYSNDEPVVILHVDDAVTSGDSMVWFRKSDVVVTGEIFNEASFPYIDLAHGGTHQRHPRRAEHACSTSWCRSTTRKAARW